MKLLSTVSAVLIFAFFLSGCGGNPGNKTEISIDSLKAGEKPVYTKTGNLHFIVESKDGKANGRVREYYPDGKIYMDATYKDDHRHGKCTHYFKNGRPFSVAYFINGKKDSIETKYDVEGKILALVPYKDDKVQPGLREFKKDGSELTDNTRIVVKIVNQLARGGKYYLLISLTPHRDNVRYYTSPKSDADSRVLLKMSGKEALLEVPVLSSDFIIEDVYIDAEYKTSMGNTRRLQKLHKFSAGG